MAMHILSSGRALYISNAFRFNLRVNFFEVKFLAHCFNTFEPIGNIAHNVTC